MNDFVSVISAADIPNGTMKTVMISGIPVALANVDGTFFAVNDLCSHKQCSLGTEGVLDGTVVVCGCHGARFDMGTGKALSLPATTDVATYETKVENGNVWVKVL